MPIAHMPKPLTDFVKVQAGFSKQAFFMTQKTMYVVCTPDAFISRTQVLNGILPQSVLLKSNSVLLNQILGHMKLSLLSPPQI